MRILFAAPAHVGFLGEAGGVLRLMHLWEHCLRDRGHQIVYASPWERPAWDRFSLCHLFMANGDSYNLGACIREQLPFVVSPIIDRTQSNFLLRCNVWLDHSLPRYYSHLGRCAALCRMADLVCLHSSEEANRVRHGLGVHTPARMVLCPILPREDCVQPSPGHLASLKDRPFLLFVGDAGNARKNVVRLIRAVEGTGLDLVIAGSMSTGKQKDRVLALAARSRNVHVVGFLSAPELDYAWRQTRALLLPSLTEVIGLAAVQAALRGTTVVVSRHGGGPDYFGDDAYYVDPYSVSDIRRQVLAAVAHPRDASAGLKERLSMERAGELLEACYLQCIEAAQRRMRLPGPSGCRKMPGVRAADAA